MRKLYHFHIAKTAGTTLNEWLDTYCHASRAQPANVQRNYVFDWREVAEEQEGIERNRQLRVAFRQDIPLLYDVIHCHESVLGAVSEDTYVFTVLRDPVSRTLSQYRDFKRLQPHDYEYKKAPAIRMHQALCEKALHQVASEFKDEKVFRYAFEDPICRILALDRLGGFGPFIKAPREQRIEAALQTLEEEFDFVGLTERFDETVTQLARVMQCPPPEGISRRNATNKEPSKDDLLDEEVAAELCAADVTVYNRAVELFESVISSEKDRYNTQMFEERFAATTVRRTQPYRVGEAFVYDMNMPVATTGFHARDAAGSEDCARWAGATRSATLYLDNPVYLEREQLTGKPSREVKVDFFLKGWVSTELRNGLRVLVDGEPVDWSASNAKDCFEVISVTHRPERSWFRVDFETERTMNDRDCGLMTDDTREKTFLLWKFRIEAV